MAHKLESFYTIEQWSAVERELVVRFLPDFFAPELTDPVLTVIVTEPLDLAAAEAGLTTWQAEMIVEIQASEGALQVWGEYDDAPLSIQGQEVQLTRSAYSSQDLFSAIVRMRAELDSVHSESRSARNHLQEVEQFVVDLINRAETKKKMSSRNTAALEAQIDALSRVLSRIRGA